MSSSSSFPKLVVFVFMICSIICLHLPRGQAQIHDIGFDWATSSSLMSPMLHEFDSLQLDDHHDDDVTSSEINGRRSLYWKRMFYISYGALSANRVPCPPRSGRSYYTHNCYGARAPANPYSRGCSCITRCRR